MWPLTIWSLADQSSGIWHVFLLFPTIPLTLTILSTIQHSTICNQAVLNVLLHVMNLHDHFPRQILRVALLDKCFLDNQSSELLRRNPNTAGMDLSSSEYVFPVHKIGSSKCTCRQTWNTKNSNQAFNSYHERNQLHILCLRRPIRPISSVAIHVSNKARGEVFSNKSFGRKPLRRLASPDFLSTDFFVGHHRVVTTTWNCNKIVQHCSAHL